jgi:16S rRNA (cytosine967-C5)-methyltransferase
VAAASHPTRRSAGPRRPGGAGRGQRGRPRPPAADPARSAALEVLRAVADRGAYANLLLPSVLAQRHLTGRDAALATELTYGTLRGQGTYDAVLAACSARALAKIDPPVLDVLRLGTHQLLATRVRPHAAVATSVELIKAVTPGGAAGFVNAVLRKVASRDLAGWIDVTAPDAASDPIGHLAVRYSHPRWVVAAFAEALAEDTAGGLAETRAALAANGTRPLVSLCAVPGRASQADLADQGARPARWSEFGGYLDSGDPAALALVRQGRAGVQDEASQLAALALTRAPAGEPGTRWLDLCAGPGGKARLLAGLAAGRGAHLLAADARPHRAALVHAALASAAVAGTTSAVVIADGTRPGWRAGAFDRVLADVPCSGLGALRRRPEARWRKTPGDVAALGGLQRRLLASALDAARPGGVVAYVTCSPHVGETSDVVTATLAGRADISVLDAPGVLAEVPGLGCPADARFAQFWPHRHGTDAIFLALLRRTPDAHPRLSPPGAYDRRGVSR